MAKTSELSHLLPPGKMPELAPADDIDPQFAEVCSLSAQELSDGIDGDLHMYKPSRDMTFGTVTGYGDLAAILTDAYNQSARGKGKERHNGRSVPFDRQPIMEIGRMCGLGYATGQASKKTQEAVSMFNRGDTVAAERELLGAIVYTAAAIKLIRE